MHLDPSPCRPHRPAGLLPAPDATASLRAPLVVALLATLSALALIAAPGPLLAADAPLSVHAARPVGGVAAGLLVSFTAAGSFNPLPSVCNRGERGARLTMRC